jgi:hypothetical protein
MKHYILAVDPGLTSGLAFFKRTDDNQVELLWTDELDWKNTARRADAMLREFGGEDVQLVVERFTITAATAKNSQQQWSIEIIGMLRMLALAHGAGELDLQSPADAKRFCTNIRLKALGFWHVGGGGHALDGIRHGVLWLTRHGWSDRRLLHD